MEDFVTFEIAKKLEEKGFTQGFNISGCKFVFSDENTIKHISDIGAYENGYFGINVPCPTISQVLKWLREEKKIHLVVDIEPRGYFFIVNYNITTNFNDKYEFDIYTGWGRYRDDKQAALAGIKHILDNLI